MRRGEIVEVDWPYSDLSGSKVRPALVVRADFLNGLIDDTILLLITGTRWGIPGTEVTLGPADEVNSGLSKLCYVSCYNFLTRDQAVIGPIIGYLSDPAMSHIEACLKTVLDLP